MIKTLERLLTWFKHTEKYWISLYFIVVLSLTLFVFYLNLPIVNSDASNQISKDITFNFNRIDKLEKDALEYNILLNKQIAENKRLFTDLESLSNTNKQLEKRIQAHTELLKRTCEYIVVITVDKKILPRQCMPDYNWRREEGF